MREGRRAFARPAHVGPMRLIPSYSAYFPEWQTAVMPYLSTRSFRSSAPPESPGGEGKDPFAMTLLSGKDNSKDNETEENIQDAHDESRDRNPLSLAVPAFGHP